jgi:hypothetical protein
MRLHGNAALSWSGRRRLAERVVVEGWTLTAAADAAGVSLRCARKWAGRYRLEGERGLLDRSSRPRRIANRTPEERIRVILARRRLRFTGPEIAELLGMAVPPRVVIVSESETANHRRSGPGSAASTCPSPLWSSSSAIAPPSRCTRLRIPRP